MKATGIIRRIDDLGRVVIPRELRKTIFGKGDVEGQPMEVFYEEDGTVIFKPYMCETVRLSRVDIENLIGYVHTLLGFIDLEGFEDKENVNTVKNGYENFVKPIENQLKEDK